MDVYLWDQKVGDVQWDKQRAYAIFEYSQEFLSSGLEVSPLMMPLSMRKYAFPELTSNTFLGLPGLLADALPDDFGRTTFDNWLSRETRHVSNPVERLGFQGNRSMGALEFQPINEPALEEQQSIDIPILLEAAREATLPITREDLLTVASEMNVKGAKKIIDQVVEAVAQWPRLAKEHSDIPQTTIDAIEKTHVYL